MQVGPKLQFKCLKCEEDIFFSALDSYFKNPIVCSKCKKKYALNEDIMRQLKKFEALCSQIHESKEILGNTAVAITLDSHEVKIPYRMLLTRFNSIIKLKIGKENLEIAFRIEPLKDIPNSAKGEKL